MRRMLALAPVFCAITVTACSLARAPVGARGDGGRDARADTGDDARVADAGPDSDLDANADAGFEAGNDAGVDTGPGSPDTGADAGRDSGLSFPPLPAVTLVLDERGQAVSGSHLASWVDQSPRGGNDFSQNSPNFRPSTSGAIGGWPAPGFDGVHDHLTAAANWDAVFGTTGGHLWVVFDNTGVTPGADQPNAWWEPAIISSSSSGGIALLWSASGPRAYAYNGAACLTPRVAATPGLHVIELGYDGSTFSMRLDHGPDVIVSCPAPLTNFGPTGYLGRNSDGTQSFGGRIAAVIGANGVPSPAAIAAVRVYLATKYGAPAG